MTKARRAVAVAVVAIGVAVPPIQAEPVTRDQPRPADEERPDHVRPRGGLNLGGGSVLVPQYQGSGATVYVAARIGIQLNHYFGIYYQNAPNLLFSQDTQEGMRVLAGFVDQNSLLLSLTLGHFFEIALGPAADVTVLTECSQELAMKKIQKAIDELSLDLMPFEGKTGVHPAAHAKIAIHLLGWSGDDAERMGLSFIGDAHPSIVEGIWVVTATGGVGVEWF